MLSLKNKKILIVGASENLGRQTAITLSKLDAKLVISGENKKELEKTLSFMKGNMHQSVVFDVHNLNSVKKFLEDIVKIDGEKLYGLVYCTEIMPIKDIESTDYEFLNHVMTTNYYGFVELAKHFSNKTICDEGSIVTISSYASLNPYEGQLAYGASKAAMDNSIVVMAKEFFKKSIRINAIRPAIIKDNNSNKISPKIEAIVDEMGTDMIEPEYVAWQIAFLLSDLSNGVYGRCFDVRGYLS